MSLEPEPELIQLRKEVGKATFILEDVEIGLEINRGAYGVVNEVKISGTLYAGKMPHDYLVKEDKKFLKKFCDEVLLHTKQHHPNIVQVIGLHYPPSSRFIPMLIMEHLPMTLGDCLENKQPMPEELKQPQTQYSILLGVANGLIYLHEKEPPVYHRDLNAYNVLLTANFTAKISDLGMSRIVAVTGEKLTTGPGNVHVMPPEARKEKSVYNHKIDVFAFGCLILHIASGQFPVPLPEADSFQENPNDDTCTSYIKITEWSRRYKYVKAIPDEDDHELLPLAQQCLEDNPRDRPEMIYLVHFIENTKTIGLIDSNLVSIIRNAPEVTICGKRVPNCRSCPTCSYIIEHAPDGSKRSSKFIVCPRCKKEYCFLCLQARDACLKDAPESWYGDCARNIAPRQTGKNN